jgi:inner membrane protein
LDNLTHTLAGVLAGETLSRVTRSSPDGLPEPDRRNLIVTMMAIGSNVPDLDFLSSAISGDKLEYMLEHRGHTHTIIGAVIGAAILYACCLLWCRLRRQQLSSTDRVQLAGISLLALLLHVTMDFTNNYGVHPFWPFYNGWLYGDTIFIWEPLLWSAVAPLIFILRTKLARVLIAALLLAAIAACFGSGLVPTGFAIFMVVLTAAMLAIGRQVQPRIALFASIGLWLAITFAFALSRVTAESQLRAFIEQRYPGETVLDYVLTPMPADPLCWNVMLPMTTADRYIVRHGVWAVAPGLVPADRCPGRGLFKEITGPLTAVADAPSLSMDWQGEIVMPRDELATLAKTNCEAAAFLQFARVPWAMRRQKSWIVGDLRYDREPGLGFAELELVDGVANCPSRTLPWLPPRSDLLR